MDKIKYGQIGVGHAHASKISVFRESPEYEVVGVVESDPALRERAQKDAAYQGVPWMTEEQLLNAQGLQLVGVETQVRNLLDTAERCVNAGFHVHLDKPAGESYAQYARILDAAARKHLLVQMGYMFRYSPAVVLLRDFLKKGWLGKPFEVHAVMSKVITAGQRTHLAEYRGGMMFELGCHVIDLVVNVLGAPQKIDPYAQNVAGGKEGLSDNMLAVFTYPAALATVKSSGLEVEGFARRHLVVCGDEGTFHNQPLDGPSVRIALAAPRGKYHSGSQEIEFGDYPRYVGDAADLAKVIRGEKMTEFTYEHDLAVQRAVLLASGLKLDDAG